MSKVALVLGGAGNIGSATAKAFAQDCCCKHVVITSRSQERIDKSLAAIKTGLKPDEAAKLIGVVGNPGVAGEVEKLKEKVVAAVGGSIDYVVSSMGFPFHDFGGPLVTVSLTKLQEVFDTQFFPTFGGYTAFMPLVKKAGGSYVFVTGGGPDTFLGIGTGGLTIGGSSNTALAKVAMKENAAEGICCSEISFQAGITPNPSVMPPGFTWLPSADAGKALVNTAIKRKAHVQTLVVKSANDLQQIIAHGTKEESNGVA